MSESIGSAISALTNFNVNTLMPSITDNADIQEALRLYHYGAPSGTGVGQYDPTNTNAANLKNPSIAHALYSLQTQISNVSGSLGVQASTWSAKGVLVSATAASTVSALTVGTNGQVLTANSATSTGLQWATPAVTDVNTVTLTNKTLTAPKITASSFIADTNGNSLISFPALVTSAVNQITVTNAATTAKPTISATGTDTNITLNLVSKGTGTVQVNGVDIDTISGTQTLTNKTLTTPTINAPTVTQLYLSDSVVIFEGATADAFETTLGVIDPTADRTINLPNVDGTVITTGNLSSITTVGTVTTGSFPAANLSGTTLASGITSASLTTLSNLSTVGTITSGSFPAANLSGTTLASNVISASITSLPSLTTVGTITTGSFPAANISGTTLASNVVTSSLTTVGTLGSLAVTNAISAGSITTTGAVTATGNVIGHIAFNTTPTGTYTLVTADDGKVVEMANGGTLTVPADGGAFVVPVGSQITILQTGATQVTIVGSGATVNGTPGLKLRAQWSSCTLMKRAANTWVALGDLIA